MAEDSYAVQANAATDVAAEMDGVFVLEGQRLTAGAGWAWIADGWAFMGLQRGTFIGLFVIYLLLMMASGFVPFAGSIAAALFGPVLTAGIVLGCDALRRGERLDVSYLFAAFKTPQVGSLIGVGAIILGLSLALVLVMAVIFLVGFFALGGPNMGADAAPAMFLLGLLVALVVIALSVPIYMAIFFAPALIVLHGFNVGAAIKTSFSVCLKNILPFTVWGLAAFVLAIPATLVLGLGWLLLGPLLMVSIYASYRDIFFAR